MELTQNNLQARIATRYDKLKRNYQSSVALACIFLWLPL